mgnify:CR=1 FL=1
MSELTYELEDGRIVKTAQFLRNRGSCCKSFCLHCPYGTTLKKHGLQFRRVKDTEFEFARELIDKKYPVKEESLADSLMAGAFGKKETKPQITEKNREDFLFMSLKDHLCGLVYKGRFGVKEVFHCQYFDDQGLSKETVESFLNQEQL